ncbi:DUF6364 family protein [Flavobacterium tegetincola]|uniref:DUF6364 family protein n=1 Tax=Flavobacterium tegetincola TaxID=150172 RepID=UPI00040FA17E|nr:DUF6364 family protein [Flavobacterium tegetincola]
MENIFTLKIDKKLLKKANEYAKNNKKTLSEIIESYLRLVVLGEKNVSTEEIIISDFVKSLSVKTNLSTDFDYKKEYQNHLIEKYK